MPTNMTVCTEKALRCIALAQHEPGAQFCMGNILVGLIEEKSGIAAKQLKNMKVDVSKVRALVKQMKEERLTPTEIDAFVEAAHKQALKIGHNHVGTEHLLLALLADERAKELLVKLGVDSGAVREHLLRMLGCSVN